MRHPYKTGGFVINTHVFGRRAFLWGVAAVITARNRIRVGGQWVRSGPHAWPPIGTDIRTLGGVVGDGREETNAIQIALDATTAGETLWIPAGVVCSHSGVLQARNAGMRIVGPGELRASNAATSSLIVSAANVTIENLVLNLPHAPTITITGAPTGGTFTLTFLGQTTTAIAWNASAATVQAALIALSNIDPGDVVVTGGPGPATAWVASFGGQYVHSNPTLMTATSSLTGGTAPAIAVTLDRIPTPRNSHKLTLDFVTGTTLRNVTSMGSAATGIRIGGSSGYLLDGCTVDWSRADGIHNTDSSHDGTIRNCNIVANGDDMISIVSYDNDVGGPTYNIVVDGCSGRDNFPKGRGFTVVGGHDITFSNFTITNPNSAGIYIAAEESFHTQGCANIIYRNGTVTGASQSASNGAIMVVNTVSTTLSAIDLITLDTITISGTSAVTNRDVRYTNSPGPITRVNAKNITITTTLSPFTTTLPTSGYKNANWVVNGSGIADVGTYVPPP